MSAGEVGLPPRAADVAQEPQHASPLPRLGTGAPASPDSTTFAVKMALAAFWLGCAIHAHDGFLSLHAIYFLTVALAFCLAAIVFPTKKERVSVFDLSLILVAGTAVQVCLLLVRTHERAFATAVLAAFLLGLLQFFDVGRFRVAALALTAMAFLCASTVVIHSGKSRIDVYAWQQHTSAALLKGVDPYEVRIANPYENADFYGSGVVDQAGYLTVGFPYPPLNLLLVLPSYLVFGDIRFAHALAIALAMASMALARPETWKVASLAALLFLLTPRVFFIVWASWTEPLLLLTFSLTMFCACRWRKGFPWALGLFLATKQYAVLALPLLPLLVQGPQRWKQMREILIKAALVVAVIDLPFFFWNMREFTRAIVVYQFLQPFRIDSLSYPAFLYSLTGAKLPGWVTIAVLAVAIAIALWRSPRSPAGFAAAMTLVSLLFFAFAKQAFCNYYYFVIGSACWAVTAAKLPLDMRRTSRAD